MPDDALQLTLFLMISIIQGIHILNSGTLVGDLVFLSISFFIWGGDIYDVVESYIYLSTIITNDF